jgi:hypothetical protein
MLKQRHSSMMVILIAVLFACSNAQAQEEDAAPSVAPPSLAQRSLAGPSTEIVFGGLMLGAAAPTALVAAFMAGPGITLCSDDLTHHCDGAGRDSRSVRTGWGVGLSMAALGAVLVGHGAHRVREVRLARRSLRLSGITLELEQGRALSGFEISF